MSLVRILASILLLATLSLAQVTPAQDAPVGLVIKASDGNLVRAGNELALAIRSGDLVYSGDTLRASGDSITFLYCPERSLYTLDKGTEAIAGPAQIQVKTGKLSGKAPAPHCYLPSLSRNTPASQQHNGASLKRALNPSNDAGFAARLAALAADRRAALEKEIAPLDQAVTTNPNDPLPHIGRAEVLSKYGLAADAAAAYQKVTNLWPDAVWLKSRLFSLEVEAEKSPGAGAQEAAGAPGKTYALLIGVSKFQNKDVPPLSFAHEDALLMREYLRSERGGKLPDEDLVMLINEEATTAAIRNAFESFLKARATKNDSVILLIATHGTVLTGKGRPRPYIVTHDADPQDLDTTGLPMGDVQKLIQEELAHVGRVTAFIDVCRSGTIGTIPQNARGVNNGVDGLAQSEGQLFLFTASRSNEFSFEGPQYGGGHGAFSFFLLEALNGTGDLNNDGNVQINELIEYTQNKVVEGTADRQHPRENGTYEGTTPFANTKLSGIAMKKFEAVPEGGSRLTLVASRSLEPTAAVTSRQRTRSTLREAVDFEEAIERGRLLPDASANAFTALRQYQRRVKPPEYLQQAMRLKSALEDRGQQVLIKYLAGEQVAQTKEDFAAGAAYFSAAKLLSPESVLLEARESFCLGRMRLFDKDYQAARTFLERSARLDPTGAYSFNALGIAALEQADYPRAAQAFRESAKRAPVWAYPLHNLALTYTQLGDYQAAIDSYREAMRLAPSYSYLPYNLGLVYQRLNRRRDAEAAFRKAIALRADDPMAFNALGFLFASAGKRSQAEQNYRLAMQKDANALEPRHNLAVLLAERKPTLEQAITLWRENLTRNVNYLPSRISLAKTLASEGKTNEAIAEYKAVAEARKDYSAARLALAQLLAKQGDTRQALDQLAAVLKLQPASAQAWELTGDLEKAAGRAEQARQAWSKALEYSADGSDKKRIRKKM
jgi:tetratricopeptide (TPR) repeat protein